jgi:hypothetical protein
VSFVIADTALPVDPPPGVIVTFAYSGVEAGTTVAGSAFVPDSEDPHPASAAVASRTGAK